MHILALLLSVLRFICLRLWFDLWFACTVCWCSFSEHYSLRGDLSIYRDDLTAEYLYKPSPFPCSEGLWCAVEKGHEVWIYSMDGTAKGLSGYKMLHCLPVPAGIMFACSFVFYCEHGPVSGFYSLGLKNQTVWQLSFTDDCQKLFISNIFLGMYHPVDTATITNHLKDHGPYMRWEPLCAPCKSHRRCN